MNESAHIWVPKLKMLEPDRELLLPCNLKGFYKIEAVDVVSGRRRVLADWFPNLITDNGLELIGTTSGYFTYMSVGSGNTAPVNANTTLAAFVASTNNVQSSNSSSAGSAPWYGAYTFTMRFAAGVATGNLAEVGLGLANNGTNLFSRALILDGGGTPTTITVLSTEALDVTYQFRNYAPTADVTGNVVISGVTYAYTVRAADASGGNWINLTQDHAGIGSFNSYNGAIQAVTLSPSGASGASSGITNAGYSAGSHRVDGTIFMDLNDSNLSGGITAARTTLGQGSGRLGAAQYGFSPAIPKDNTHTLTLVLRHVFGRGP